MKNRRWSKVATTLFAMTLLSGCGRVLTAPQESDTSGGSTGGYGNLSTLPSGTISGRIVNSRTKLGIAGVQITLMGAGVGSSRSTTTNGAGEFTLSQVPATKQKLSLYKQGYTYMASNGDVVVDVIAGTTITTPDIALTEAMDAVPNAFVSSFGNVPWPQYLAYDKSNNYIYTVAKTNPTLFGGAVQLPTQEWEVRRFDTNGALLKHFGASFDWLVNDSRVIFQPMDMTCDAGGNLYLCDPKGNFGPSNPVKRYDLEGNLQLPSNGLASFSGVGQPFGITALRDGFAVVNKAGSLLVYNSAQQLTKTIPVSTNVAAVAAESSEDMSNLYVIDNGSQTAVIKKYDLRSTTPDKPTLYFGTLHGRGANQFESPTDLAVDPRNGDLYIVDSGNNRVVRYSSQGTYLSEFGGMGSAPGQFNKPTGITIDKDGFVYVADTNNHRIQKFNPSPMRQVGQVS